MKGIEKVEAPALRREHMPRDFRISLDRCMARPALGIGYQRGETRIPKDFGPSQAMRGFEKTYRNIIDYIVRITYRIWEDRDVEYILGTYSEDSRIFDDYGLQRGNRKIVDDTHHTTGAFSDIRLIADEIVWAGDDETGYRSSHRTLIRGTNDGDSKYGPATGREVDVLVIANCVARENRIFLEHVLYNNSSLLAQLGMDLGELATRMAATPPAGWPRSDSTWNDLRSAARPQRPLCESEPVSGFDVDRFARENFDALWNARDFDILGQRYARDFPFRGPTERDFSGFSGYVEFLQSMLTAFPDLELRVDEVYWMGNEADGYLTSERWSATATHAGPGLYGEPSGCEVQIWGITQHRIVREKVVREWMLFNELDLMMQIAAARQGKRRV